MARPLSSGSRDRFPRRRRCRVRAGRSAAGRPHRPVFSDLSYGLGGARRLAPGVRRILRRRRQRLPGTMTTRRSYEACRCFWLKYVWIAVNGSSQRHTTTTHASVRKPAAISRVPKRRSGPAKVATHRSASHAEIARDDRHRQVGEDAGRRVACGRMRSRRPASPAVRMIARCSGDAIQRATARALPTLGDDQSRFSPTVQRCRSTIRRAHAVGHRLAVRGVV